MRKCTITGGHDFRRKEELARYCGASRVEYLRLRVRGARLTDRCRREPNNERTKNQRFFLQIRYQAAPQGKCVGGHAG